MGVRRRRVLCVLAEYPQISQTYIKAELDALAETHDLTVVTRGTGRTGYRHCHPHVTAGTADDILDIAGAARPDIIHTHWLTNLRYVVPVAERLGIPFTVRSHSFDVQSLWWNIDGAAPTPGTPRDIADRYRRFKQRRRARLLNHVLCRGVLALPFTRPLLERVGVRPDRIVDCRPAIAFDRFHNRAANGDGVMNTGAALGKKRMDSLVRLARDLPDLRFRFYAVSYRADDLKALGERLGGVADFRPPVEPDDMPAEYKRHRWLVYPPDLLPVSIGWPVSVAEAQASGVGVCVPAIRPDLRDYVGAGGFVYESLEDLVEIVRAPLPADVRDAGFEVARQSDIRGHLHRLTDLWDGRAA